MALESKGATMTKRYTLFTLIIGVFVMALVAGCATTPSIEEGSCPCKWDGPEYCPDVICVCDLLRDLKDAACPCKWDGDEYCPDVVCVCEETDRDD